MSPEKTCLFLVGTKKVDVHLKQGKSEFTVHDCSTLLSNTKVQNKYKQYYFIKKTS